MSTIETVQVQKFKDVYENNMKYIDRFIKLDPSRSDKSYKNIIEHIEHIYGYKIHEINPLVLSNVFAMIEHAISLGTKETPTEVKAVKGARRVFEKSELSKSTLNDHNKYYKKKFLVRYLLQNKPANNTKANDYYAVYCNADKNKPATKVTISKMLRSVYTDLTIRYATGSAHYMIDDKKTCDSLDNAKKYLESIIPYGLEDKIDLESDLKAHNNEWIINSSSNNSDDSGSTIETSVIEDEDETSI